MKIWQGKRIEAEAPKGGPITIAFARGNAVLKPARFCARVKAEKKVNCSLSRRPVHAR
jgi:hypothetical protein